MAVKRIELRIDWVQLIQMQSENIERGFNHMRLPDLIIAQNAIAHDVTLFENDKHFAPMVELFGLRILRPVDGRQS